MNVAHVLPNCIRVAFSISYFIWKRLSAPDLRTEILVKGFSPIWLNFETWLVAL